MSANASLPLQIYMEYILDSVFSSLKNIFFKGNVSGVLIHSLEINSSSFLLILFKKGFSLRGSK